MQSPDLSFLQVKIVSIGTALFFCENKSMLPFPAYIVTALKTDEQGNIWFFVSRNWSSMVSYETTGQAKLEFYRKGYPFTLKIEGSASLVNDKGLMLEFMQELLGKSVPVSEDAIDNVLLVKVKIEKADYRELRDRKPAERPLKQLLANIKQVWQPMPDAAPQWQPAL